MRTKLNHNKGLSLCAILFTFSSLCLASISNLETCKSHLNTHPNLQIEGNEARFLYQSKSKTGTHLTFGHYYRGSEVKFSQITFHIIENRDDAIIQDKLLPAVGLGVIANQESFVVVYRNNSFQYAVETFLPGPYSLRDTLAFISLDGVILFKHSTRIFKAQPDTTIHLPVFKPNPVVSSGGSYGYLLKDRNDEDHDAFKDEYKWVPLAFNGHDPYLPYSSLFSFTEVSSPFDSSFIFKNQDMPLDRSHPGFETANAAYHLENYAYYLRIMGYTDLLQPLQVDPHGMNGQDQSAFNGYAKPPSLEFGEGGVDDAEDGQVIIHEYCHSLVHAVSPFTYNGSDRKSIEEGSADYLAMSYTYYLTGEREDNVFSWDGHNEFWDGFVLDASKNYSTKTDMPSEDREIWSACLSCIWTAIGNKATDELVFESMYYLKPEITMPEMAHNYLVIDTLLNNAENVSSINNCFYRRGIITGDAEQLFPSSGILLKVLVLNSGSTGYESKPLQIYVSHEIEYTYFIYDMMGRLCVQEDAQNRLIEPDVRRLTHGLYTLLIETKTDGRKTPIRIQQRIMR